MKLSDTMVTVTSSGQTESPLANPPDLSGGFSHVYIPASFVAKAERYYETRSRAELKRKANGPRNRDRSKMDWRPFCFWDGEGPRDAGYALFGSSMGDEICHPHLSTIECLELLLNRATESQAIHVWYGGNYDVSMILHDIGFRHFARLKKNKFTIWRGYRIEYVPRKWMAVSNGKVKIKIYDVVSFFAGKYTTALENMGIGPWQQISMSLAQTAKEVSDCDSTLTQKVLRLAWLLHNYQTNAQTMKVNDGNSGSPILAAIHALEVLTDPEIVALFKEERSNFTYSEIELIKRYWRLELKYGVELMDKLRATFDDAGFRVNSWHGPGALARVALKRHQIELAMYDKNEHKLPKVLEIERFNAVRSAFAGGRFEMIHGGYFAGTIYNADIRSAYPYFATHLPNLAKGIWRYVTNYEPAKFGVYHIQYTASGKRNHDRIYPLFDRRPDGQVVWPAEVEGWYWNPEAELVADDKDALFIEGWVFDEYDETDRPFAWLSEYYFKRQLLKDIGNAAEFTFKLIINSVYGQLAQRTGWDERNRKAPRYHQLEWAGYITSACRARVYRFARMVPSKALVSIDTDGIYSTEPLPIQPSSDLGGWDISTYAAGLFWQSGIYCLANERGDWGKGKVKSRGIPKGQYSYEILRNHYDNGMTPLSLTKNTFIGFGLALNGRFSELNTWRQETHKVLFGGGNIASGKRYHNKRHCNDACDGDVHVFRIGLFRPEMSNLHRLPWLEALDEPTLTHDDMIQFDLNDLDDGEAYAWQEYEPA